jgi:hypothetical protein
MICTKEGLELSEVAEFRCVCHSQHVFFLVPNFQEAFVTSAAAFLDTIPRKRDHRLDLARGFMLLIIFVAHVPNNLFADFIPARFGFSSGAEIFVFVSGIASGLAFGGTFLKKGFAEGTRRIARRILQLYGAHIILLFTLAAGALALDYFSGTTILAERYGLEFLREQPLQAIQAYMSLQYVPAFFDILPMYVILLALIVPAMLLARVSPLLVTGFSALLWYLTPVLGLHLSGHPVTGANWYFNPFAWQFLFFIGFSFGIGWLPAPQRKNQVLFPLAIGVLVLSIPVTGWPFFSVFDGFFVMLNSLIYPPDAITILHYTRLVHFLSLAYVCFSLVDPKAAWLEHPWLAPLYRIGRNSFGSFLAGVVLSLLGGVVIDWAGLGWFVAILVNVTGIFLLLFFARGMDRIFGKAHAGTALARSKLSMASQPAENSVIANDRSKSAHLA